VVIVPDYNLITFDDSVVGQQLPMGVAGQLPVQGLVQKVAIGSSGPFFSVWDTSIANFSATGLQAVGGVASAVQVGADALHIVGFVGAGDIFPGAKSLVVDVSAIFPPGQFFYNQGNGLATFFHFAGAVLQASYSCRAEPEDQGGTPVISISFMGAPIQALSSGQYSVMFSVLGRFGP
jgi:hypothetical protein